MDQLFAIQTKELISKSREIAIDMGYSYISTLHFFLADCEGLSKFSILNFAFKNVKEYDAFKSTYKQNEIDYLNFIDENIPLTLEAEISIRESYKEQQNFKQELTFPWHILIAAIKNKKSVLCDCFKNDSDVDEKLISYYQHLGAFDIQKISKEPYLNKSTDSIIDAIKRYLRIRN